MTGDIYLAAARVEAREAFSLAPAMLEHPVYQGLAADWASREPFRRMIDATRADALAEFAVMVDHGRRAAQRRVRMWWAAAPLVLLLNIGVQAFAPRQVADFVTPALCWWFPLIPALFSAGKRDVYRHIQSKIKGDQTCQR